MCTFMINRKYHLGSKYNAFKRFFHVKTFVMNTQYNTEKKAK